MGDIAGYVSQFSSGQPVLFIDSSDYPSGAYRFYRDSVIKNLDFAGINSVINQLAGEAGFVDYRKRNSLSVWPVLAKYMVPVQDMHEIHARQEAVQEIYENPALEKSIEDIVLSVCELGSWSESSLFSMSISRKSEEVHCLVKAVESALAIAPKNERLKQVNQHAVFIAQLPEYRLLKSYSAVTSQRFQDYFGSRDSNSHDRNTLKDSSSGAYLVAMYMNAANSAEVNARCIGRLNVDARRRLYSALKDLHSIFKELLHNPALESLIDRQEAKDLGLEAQMNYAMSQLRNTAVLDFRYRITGTTAQKYFVSGFRALLKHVTSLFREGLDAAMCKCDYSLKPMAQELSFYCGLAQLAHRMAEKSPVVMPVLLEMDKRYCSIKAGNVPSFVLRDGPLVANNVLSNKENCVFLLTGANDNGKTSYERMVGQMQALAQLGSFVPAKSAKMSLVDCVITSFGGADKPDKKEGSFKSALNFLSFIIKPASSKAVSVCRARYNEDDWDDEDEEEMRERGIPPIEDLVADAFDSGLLFFTPRSLLLFDEIAIGSDNQSTEEAILRTLVAAQQRGARLLVSTHYHPIAERVQKGEFPGVMNLGAVMCKKNGKLVETYKIRRGRHEPSYGQRLFKEAGFTQEDVDNAAQLLAEAGVIDAKPTQIPSRRKKR